MNGRCASRSVPEPWLWWHRIRMTKPSLLAVFRELDRSFTTRERDALRAVGAEVLDLVRPLAVAAFSDLAEAVGIVGACPDSKA